LPLFSASFSAISAVFLLGKWVSVPFQWEVAAMTEIPGARLQLMGAYQERNRYNDLWVFDNYSLG